MTIEDLVEQTIPIYTTIRPNPETGKPDCKLDRIYKDGLRHMMRKKLEAAGDDESLIEQIVKQYKR